MSSSTKQSGLNGRRWLVAIAIVGVLAAVAWATSSRWLSKAPSNQTAHDEHAGHEHAEAEHDHDHAGHSEATSIELSEKALKNIGYQPVTIKLGPFVRTVTLPGIVVGQPGRTQLHITAPLTGVVTEIHVALGQAIEPGSPMFEIRLTHEELVTAQKEYLQTAENLDVVDREITRLRSLGEGVIAGKRILEQEYEKQKLQASLRATEQALLLHGLDEEQVQQILKTRKLLNSLTIRAPKHSHPGSDSVADHWFHVQSLPVSPGEQVDAGQELCVLADHCELLVEGKAFEDDAVRLRQALQEGWLVSAVLMAGDRQTETIDGLKLHYLADQIDPESRAFHFYIQLPNKVVLDQEPSPGRRFIEWRFKPGQRMELRVPVEEWNERIVLPVESTVDEGAEAYVYRQNGDHFDRVPIHVEYRDRNYVVIANDGALFPGDIVAGRGAYQIHLALKNKSGGGIDPHAGHNH
ncbi:MAG: efflux RND transporter periplasmic adaptor subunit [Pirellulales bacterium]